MGQENYQQNHCQDHQPKENEVETSRSGITVTVVVVHAG